MIVKFNTYIVLLVSYFTITINRYYRVILILSFNIGQMLRIYVTNLDPIRYDRYD